MSTFGTTFLYLYRGRASHPMHRWLPSSSPYRYAIQSNVTPFPAGKNPNLAGRLSAAIPPDCGISPYRFPTGNHQPCAKMIPPETPDFASLSGGIASLNHRLSIDDALRATAPPYGLPSSSPLHSELSPPSLAGALPGNVTYLSRRAINPRKGDSSCYPRVMPEAYPWLKLLSPWFNPAVGCIAA